MAANLTPQYLKAEEEYRRAQTPEEELRALETMFKEMPKHKASEKLQAELKSKISKVKKDIEAHKKAPKQGPAVRIPRQGAGTAVLLGAPNCGKSSLLKALTRATPEIADYPFTTRTPQPGMMPWEDVSVQLVDTPPITKDYFEPYMQGLIRGADVCVLLVDLGVDEGIEQCQELLDRLGQTRTRLGKTTRLDEEDIGLSYTRTLLALNKCDLPGAADRLELLHELLPLDFPEFVFSATTGEGLENLKNAIYGALDVIRVYTKLPTKKEADFERPFTMRAGTNLQEMAGLVHKDFADNLKYARLWGKGVHDGETIKGDHVLHDRDIVELHT